MRIEEVREWLDTPRGRMAAAGVVVVAVLAVAYSVSGFFQGSDAAQIASERPFICATSGKTFEYEMKRGDSVPVVSPHSGQKTGYPAERCYWTADGKIKAEPTPVLLEEYKGGSRGLTFCPDCKRRVVAHNPYPAEGATPPPTREEYAARATARQKKPKGTAARVGGGAGKAEPLEDAEFDER